MLAGNQLLAFTVTVCQHLNTDGELLQPDCWIFIENLHPSVVFIQHLKRSARAAGHPLQRLKATTARLKASGVNEGIST